MSARQNLTLEGHTALVTGATSGLGRAIALQLAGDGAEVIVHGRDATRGAETVSAIESAGGKARFTSEDLRDASGVQKLADAAGEVDVLVNNAGSAVFAPTSDLGADAFDALFDGNVRAPFLLVAAIAPGMVARGKGSIINIGSMSGEIGLVGGAAYGATKASLSALTRSWAAEYGSSGIRVNTVAPGPILTEGGVRERTEALGKTTLLGRAASPEEIAEVVVFLASPRASYITGAVVPVDGGRTAV